MRDIIFYFGNEVILVRIDGNTITFGNTTYGAKMADMELVQFHQRNCIIADSERWRI